MPTVAATALTALLLVTQTSPAGKLTFTAPEGWTPRPAASTMRVAEFVLPRVGSDAEDGDVVVYFFGGQGGDAEANITRWIGQMQQPDGRSSADVARRSSTTANGLPVTMVDVAGTYVAEVRPGSTEHFNKPGFRMRAAVLMTAGGPYFIKMLGPSATIARWSATLDTFLQSMHFGS
jgi:hypothetical protein